MKKSIFSSIDKSINQNIAKIRAQDFYQKMSESLRTFTEKEQLVINQSSAVFILIIPFIILLVLFIVRYQNASDVSFRKDVFNKIVSVKEDMATLSILEREYSNSFQINDKKDLVEKIEQILDSKKLKKTNVVVDNFNIAAEGGTIRKVESTVKFKDLTSFDFTNLLLEVQTRLKANVFEIEITKNEEKSLLQGSFSISLFSKKNG